MWKFAGLVSALMLSGCAAAGLTLAGAGAGAAAGAGVEHTLTGVTYKTFTEPLEKVRDATVDSLARMDMNIVEDGATPEGWAFKALAADRTIDIELQKLTENTTRMRVVANQGDIFFKDSATATEIILQTANTLDDRKTNLAEAQKSSKPQKKSR